MEPLELCLAFFVRSSKAQGLSGGCLADPRGDLDFDFHDQLSGKWSELDFGSNKLR
jgi:hypothetical protein